MASSERKLQAAILEYVKSKRATVSDPDSIDVALQVLSEAFGISDAEAKSLSVPRSLLEIFSAAVSGEVNGVPSSSAPQQAAKIEDDPMFIKFLDTVKAKGFFANLTQGTPEYEERYAKVVEKYKARAPAATKDGAPSAAAAAPVANDEVAAEKFKNEGNKLLQENKCEKAIECYTKAIEAAPTGKNTHIYYANRSAAKLQKKLKDTDGAESDARKCVSMEPGYSKGYNRLGAALESSGNFQEAMSAYERCLDADADNSVAKEALQRLKKSGSSASSSSSSKAVSSNGRPSTASAGAGAAPGGFPGMPGGLGGLAGLMQDPSMQAMAANLMKDPSALAGLMSNPMVQQMMSGMGGAGGMGGLASMFGGAGAGGGPKFNAPAAAVDDDEEMPPLETEEEAAAGGAGTGGGAPAGFPAGFNPANMPPGMASLMSDPEIAPLMQDPEVAAMAMDMQTGGPAAAMKHMGNPKFQAVMSKMMGKLGKK